MKKRKTRYAKHMTIEDLATQHMFIHNNSNHAGVRTRMNRLFGTKATDQAIRQARELRKICDPNYKGF